MNNIDHAPTQNDTSKFEEQDVQASPEVQARIDFGSKLTNMAVEWAEQNGASDGDSGNGLRFQNFKDLLAKEYPDMAEAELDTAAAEFTRDVAWFKYGKPDEADLSPAPVAEAVSRTASFAVSDIMKYTVHKLKETNSFEGTGAEDMVTDAVDRYRGAMGYQLGDQVTENMKKEVVETA